MKKFKTQKEAIFEVLDVIGGVDVYSHPESKLSYTVLSYGDDDGEYYESILNFDERGNLVSVEESEHYH